MTKIFDKIFIRRSLNSKTSTNKIIIKTSSAPVKIRIEKKPKSCFKKPFFEALNTYFRFVKNAKITEISHAKIVAIAVPKGNFDSKKYEAILTKVVAAPNIIYSICSLYFFKRLFIFIMD